MFLNSRSPLKCGTEVHRMFAQAHAGNSSSTSYDTGSAEVEKLARGPSESSQQDSLRSDNFMHETHYKRTTCRVCGGNRLRLFLSLGLTPLANSFLRSANEFPVEASYPLDAY